MKTAFILAGFDLQSTAGDGIYPVLEKGLKAKGYRVVASDISWRQKTPSHYVKEFVKLFNAQKSEENIIIGNSFGAVVAFLATPEIAVNEVYLCSLSPFFSEDRGKRPDSYGIRYFGKRRMNDLWSYSANEAAKLITNTKVHVLYGEKEHQTSPNLVNRCIDVAKMIQGAELHEIANAPHDMSDTTYSQGILKFVPETDQRLA